MLTQHGKRQSESHRGGERAETKGRQRGRHSERQTDRETDEKIQRGRNRIGIAEILDFG
jgi:hypothetical protein